MVAVQVLLPVQRFVVPASIALLAVLSVRNASLELLVPQVQPLSALIVLLEPILMIPVSPRVKAAHQAPLLLQPDKLHVQPALAEAIQQEWPRAALPAAPAIIVQQLRDRAPSVQLVLPRQRALAPAHLAMRAKRRRQLV